MNRFLFFVLLVIGAFVFCLPSMAQKPQVSTAENPIWYFVENGNNVDIDGIVADDYNDSEQHGRLFDGRFCALLTGSEKDSVVTSAYYLQDEVRDYQLWRVEMDDSGNYVLINKKNGKMLARGGDGETATKYYISGKNTTPASFIITEVAGERCKYVYLLNTSFGNNVEKNSFLMPDRILAVRNASWVDFFPLIDGEEADAPKDRGDGLVCSEMGWRFVPQEELENAYPKTGNWYQIVDYYQNDCFDVEDDGAYACFMPMIKSDQDPEFTRQVFQPIVHNPENPCFFYWQSLKTKSYLGVKQVGYSLMNTLTPDPKYATGFAIRHIYNPSQEGYKFNMSAYPRIGGAKFHMYIGGVFDCRGCGRTGDDYSDPEFHNASTWTFLEYKGSGSPIDKVHVGDVFVYVQDRRIYVKGTDAPVVVYSITGSRVDEKALLTPGAYVVRVASKSFKVLVK